MRWLINNSRSKRNKRYKQKEPISLTFDRQFKDLLATVYASGKNTGTLQIFTVKNKGKDNECMIGVTYGIRLIIEKRTVWEQPYIHFLDSGLLSDIANYHRTTPLQLTKSIAQFFQQSLYRYINQWFDITYDHEIYRDSVFEFSQSHPQLKNN